MVAVLIILISLQNGWRLLAKPKQNLTPDKEEHKAGSVLGVGIISGLMASAMAMPGPAVMLYLSRTSLSKNEIRATIITSFLFSYAGALLLQTIFIGIETQTWVTAGVLIPAALTGVAAGHMLSNKINQKLFKWLILLILMLTGLFMLFNL